MKDKLIEPGKPKRGSKSPWESRIRKKAKDAKEKQMGQGCPRKANGLRMPNKKMGHRSP